MTKPTLRVRLRALAFAVFFPLFATLWGCSSSLFTGDKKDDSNIGNGSYNKDCLGMDLSSRNLTVPTTRQFVNCLNSNGSIQGFATLVNSLDKDQLGSILSIVNQEVLSDTALFQQMDLAFEQMDQTGILNANLQNVARVLKNEKFLVSTLKLFNRLSTKSGLLGIRSHNDELDQALALLEPELTRENVARALEIGITSVNLRSFKGMVEGLKPPIKSPFTEPLKHLSTQFLKYLQNKIKDPSNTIDKTIFWGIYDGTLFKGLDHYFARSCEGKPPLECPIHEDKKNPFLSVEYQAQALETFLRFIAIDRTDVLDRMTVLFKVMDNPIHCLDQTKIIPNGNMLVMNELLTIDPLFAPQWVTRNNIVKVMAAGGVCEFPKDKTPNGLSFNDLMWALRQLAANKEQNALVTVAHLVRGMQVGDSFPIGNNDPKLREEALKDLSPVNEHERYRRFLTSLLGDRDVHTFLREPAAELLRPDRKFILNLLLFLNGQDDDDRKSIQYAIGILIRGRKELNGKSIYDVLKKTILEIDPESFYEIVSSISTFIESSEPILEPLMTSLRQGLLMSRPTPHLDLVRKILRNSDQHKDLIATLGSLPQDGVKAAASQAVTMIENGKLKELLKGMMSMMRKGSGAAPGIEPVAPPKIAERARDRAAEDLAHWAPNPAIWVDPNLKLCGEINLDIALTKPFENIEAWSQTMRTLGGCLSAGKTSADAAAIKGFIEFGLSAKVGDRSLLPYTVDLLNSFLFMDGSTDEARRFRKQVHDEIGDFLLDNSRFNRLVDLLALAPYLLQKKYSVEKDLELAPVQALGRVLSLIKSREDLTPVLSTAAEVVTHPSLGSSLKTVLEVAQRTDKKPPVTRTPKPPTVSYPLSNYPQNTKILDDLTRLIQEKDPPSDGNLQRAIQQRVRNYWHQVNAGEARLRLETAEAMKEYLKPLLDKIAKPRQLETLLEFLVVLEKNYSPEWIASWLERLSNNLEVIEYYYPGVMPGQSHPSIRVVNELDLLELIVFDAGFSPSQFGQISIDICGSWLPNSNDNFAIKYLAQLGQYVPGESMQPWVDSILGSLGCFVTIINTPVLNRAMKDEVKRRTLNLVPSTRVLAKLNRDTSVRLSDGRVFTANDLGFVRDLSRAILNATPQGDWNKWNRNDNSLALMEDFVRLGVTRFIATNLWYLDPVSKKVTATPLADSLRFLIDGGIRREGTAIKTNPDLFSITNFLLRQNCLKTTEKSCDEVSDFNRRYVVIGKLVDKLYQATADDECFEWIAHHEQPGDARARCVIAGIKRAGYYAADIAGTIQKRHSNFAANVIHLITPLVVHSSKTLTDNLDVLDPVLASPHGALFLETLSEFSRNSPEQFNNLAALADFAVGALDQNKAATPLLNTAVVLFNDPQKNLSRFVSVMRSLRQDPELERFHLGDLIEDLAGWLGQETGLRRRAQQHLSENLRNDKILNLILALGESSKDDQLYEKIKFLGDSQNVRALQDFLYSIRTGMMDNHQ